MLRVGFPLSLLGQDNGVLDPENLDTVYQYYLLENLALGLVRDSSQSPSGYEPGLADSWEHPSPTSWIFNLKDGLEWSDGTPITPSEVAAHIKALKVGNHRHIVYLKGLKSSTSVGRRILLEFSAATNDGVIHELSLADTALLHARNRSGDWTVVSGAFSVESYEPNKRLILRKNPRFPLRSAYPDRVELIGFTMDTIAKFFDTTDVDLVKVPAPTFRSPNQKLLAAAPKVLRGYPTWIYYFNFNARKPLWRDRRARCAFAAAVERAMNGFSDPILSRERQLIPAGFSGRLETAPPCPELVPGQLEGKSIKINILPSFSEAAQFRKALQDGFTQAGVSLEFSNAWSFAPADDADVQLSQFAGNQRDAMGSWQFMFSPDHGDLSAFRLEVTSALAKIMAAANRGDREKALRDLHHRALADSYAVPLFIEADAIAASTRVDISGINPFDMRLRFYDVRWK